MAISAVVPAALFALLTAGSPAVPIPDPAVPVAVKTVIFGGLSRSVTVVGRESDPKRVIVIFPGYKPDGDPFRQAPECYMKNWDLLRIVGRIPALFLIPDFGPTLHRFRDKHGRKTADQVWLRDFLQYYGGRYPDSKFLFAGVSTGTGGMIKSLELFNRVSTAVAISGTYRSAILPRESGEYRMHDREFGTDAAAREREELPGVISRLNRKIRLHLFCEENSLFRKQADWLLGQEFPGLDVRNELRYGKGLGHSWKFWGDANFVSRLHEILTND